MKSVWRWLRDKGKSVWRWLRDEGNGRAFAILAMLVGGAWTLFLFASEQAPKPTPRQDVRTGTLFRVEKIPECATGNWVSVFADDSLRLALKGTTTSLEPKNALVLVQQRSSKGDGYSDGEPVTVAVGSTARIAIGERTIGIRVTDVQTCSAAFEVTE